MSRDRSHYASSVKNASASTGPTLQAWGPHVGQAECMSSMCGNQEEMYSYVLPMVKVRPRGQTSRWGRKQLQSGQKWRLQQLRSWSLRDTAHPGHWKSGCKKVCTQRSSPSLYMLMILTETLPKVVILSGFRSPRKAPAMPAPDHGRATKGGETLTQSWHSIRTD